MVNGSWFVVRSSSSLSPNGERARVRGKNVASDVSVGRKKTYARHEGRALRLKTLFQASEDDNILAEQNCDEPCSHELKNHLINFLVKVTTNNTKRIQPNVLSTVVRILKR